MRTSNSLLLILAIVALFALACGGSDSTSTPQITAPSEVSNPVPANDAVGQAQQMTLTWKKSTDPDGGAVVYDVYLGQGDDPPLVATDLTTNEYTPAGFGSNRTYRWRVVARDNEGEESTSPLWSFSIQPCPETPGTICDFAGTGIQGNGPQGQKPLETELYWPVDVCFDPSGNPYLIDWNNHRVLDVDDQGNLRIVIGGTFGDGRDGIATEIGLNHPTHLTFDPLNGDLLLAAWHNSLIKRMDMTTRYIATICGTGARSYNGENNPPLETDLDLPVCVLTDPSGNIFFSDQANLSIRMLDTSDQLHIIAGMPSGCGAGPCAGFTGDGGPATSARLNFSRGQAGVPDGKITWDVNGNLLIADTKNHCVRLVDMTTGIISTFAGTGANRGFSGDGGPATSALLDEPHDVAADDLGNVFIADTNNQCIRMVDASGIITTIAGTPGVLGTDPYDGIPATSAHFTEPYGIEVGPNGNVWVADSQNNMVRIIYR